MLHLSVESYILHYYPKIERYPAFIKRLLFSSMHYFLHEEEINHFLDENIHKDTFSFIENIIDYFDIKIALKKDELGHIPAYGRVVIIANHPLGALDAMALMHLLKDVRKDFKIVANAFLLEFAPLEEVLIPIGQGGVNRHTFKAIYDALDEEKMVIIFPASEVSRVSANALKNNRWKSAFLKIASKTKSPILPIYIRAKNSKIFYLFSMLNRSLATAILPYEMFKAKGKTIQFTIGKTIPFDSYNFPLPASEKLKLMRKHFYRISKKKKEVFKTENPISRPEQAAEIKSALKKQGTLLGETFDGKKIILYSSTQESSVIKEIGRLREISFRFVGEGSGLKRDIDRFDFYYHHLIIWDEEALEIAGAYRLGVSSEIVEKFGVEGLYTSSLFAYHQGFSPQLSAGVELGRSFVQPKYWNSRALDYLWQGLGAFVKNRPEIRYLFGAVSISDSFNDKAKALMIYFFGHYFHTDEAWVTHKNPYRMTSDLQSYCETLFLGNDYKTNQRLLKEELGYMSYTIPTLYKQYSEVCEDGGVKFLDFGFDASFNNCIDGFIVVDLHMLKESKRKRYMGE